MASRKRFVSILSDFGFKRIFGNPANTDILKQILPILIKSDEPIREIHFDNTVKTPDYEDDRGATFDFNCIDDNKRNFLIEMQRTKLRTFIHRSKFYTYLHLNEMIEKGGEMRFNNLRPIYAVSILDGVAFPDSDEFHQFACLRNQHGELIDDQITHVLLELGKWNKTEQEIVSNLDILILLMKFTDTATIDTPTPKILTETEWAAWVMKKLEQKNLTRAERLFYRKQQAKIGYFKGLEEDAAKEAAEHKRKIAEAEQQIQQVTQQVQQVTQQAKQAEQQAKQAEQQIQQVEQQVKQAEQQAKQAEQQAKQAEQQIIRAVTNLLKESSFTEEKIAELIGIDISKVREIKAQLK